MYRLFHAEGVRVFDQKPVEFECVCSKQKCESAISALGKEEMAQMVEAGKPLDMGCEFCGATYRIELDDLTRLIQTVDP